MLAAVVPTMRRLRAKERASVQADAEAHTYGLKQPTTLHPVIDPSLCIGVGNCVTACPEAQIIGIRDGRGFVAQPALCVGHGACERACPVQAITLVFGSAERGVDLPRLTPHYETNVPGLFVVGELGGMGLIRNAFEQGRQCVEEVARRIRRDAAADGLDLVVVGCGPGGLSASLTAAHLGLRSVTLEREDIGGAVCHYPRKKVVMSAPVKVPGGRRIGGRAMTKQELVEAWTRLVQEAALDVRTGVTVEAVERQPDGWFAVRTADGGFRSRHVILAIGRRGVPKKLGVPGEELGKVAYSLREPEEYRGDRVLVVGGGDAAVEAAVTLAAEAETRVHLSYRRERFTRIRPENRTRVEEAVASGQLTVLFGTSVLGIAPGRVTVEAAGGRPVSIENDQVFIFAGGELPTPFLRRCGVVVERKFGQT